MRRVAAWPSLVMTGIILQGCPVFPDDVNDCTSHSQCPSSYQCELASGVCVRPAETRECREPGECGTREVCGADGRCHVGSCTVSGCVTGYSCEAPNGTWQCVSGQGTAGAPGSGGSAGASAAGAAGGGAPGAAGSN